jgi:tRNA A-37 threonylcarbamoyl transferase component Bud32
VAGDKLWVDSFSRSLFARAGWDDAPAVLRSFGATAQPTSSHVSIAIDHVPGSSGCMVFFKLYSYQRPSWRSWRRPSKARREFDNYSVFERLGIASPRRVACGEQRDAVGRLRHAFVVTEVVPHCRTLLQFLKRPLRGSDATSRHRERTGVLLQLAAMIRRIHDASFFHNDLYLRNVLIEQEVGQTPRIWWIDCPRGGVGRLAFLRRHRRVKDLAALDLGAVQHCSASDRLRFILAYCGRTRLTPGVKRLVREVERYRRRRWVVKRRPASPEPRVGTHEAALVEPTP